MRTIHEVLEDETAASILAQITMSAEGITASIISKNTSIPQSTVYDHLRALEKDELIYAEKIKVKNSLIKKWYRTEQKTFPDTEYVDNNHYNMTILANKKDLSSRIRFSQAIARKSLVTLEEISNEDFSQIQKKSAEPVFMRQFILNKDDYQFVYRRLIEIEEELEKRNKSSMEDRGSLFKDEKYLIFYYGLPDLPT